MDLNMRNLPDWLTEEVIAELKEDLKACSNPYTVEEVQQLPLDAPRDMVRYNAYNAKQILSHYGII